MPELDLFAANRGAVTAPAGCGKTQLIADTLLMYSGTKPILVLTHTNAGVGALRSRLNRAGVRTSAYRLSTIDGFAMNLVGMFPGRSGVSAQTLQLHTPGTDYPAIRDGAWRLLQAGHISDLLAATYSRLIVDEYQDCSLAQHTIVDWTAESLPTCVLGDPMQAIFGFRGNVLVDWNTVLTRFPSIGELSTPWRWINAGAAALGEWLLAIRQILATGGAIDLGSGPSGLTWIRLSQQTMEQQRQTAALTRAITPQGTVLIIGDSRNASGRHRLASRTPGASTVEPVDMRDLIDFGRNFNLQAPDSVNRLVEFAASLMANIAPTELLRRLTSLRQGTARNPPTVAEASLVSFALAPTLTSALNAVARLSEQPGVRVYRPEILRSLLTAMQAAADGSCTLQTATLQERERNRHSSRLMWRRSIGSTLLLKGLEAEVVVVLEPAIMDARHLYVALTRGANQIVVCSETQQLNPAR